MIAPSLKRTAGTAVIAAFVALGTAAFVSARGTDSGEITACVNNDGGGLYLASTCPGKKLTWNKQGPEGAPGPQGVAGAPGATGLQGPPGANGAQGPRGRAASAPLLVHRLVTKTKVVSDFENSLAARCPQGLSVAGGGATASGDVVISKSSPLLDEATGKPLGWVAEAKRELVITTGYLRDGIKLTATSSGDGPFSHDHLIRSRPIQQYWITHVGFSGGATFEMTVYAVCIGTLSVTGRPRQ